MLTKFVALISDTRTPNPTPSQIRTHTREVVSKAARGKEDGPHLGVWWPGSMHANFWAPWLSSWMVVLNWVQNVLPIPITWPIVLNSSCKGSTPLIHKARALYSASMVEAAIGRINWLFQMIGQPHIQIAYPALLCTDSGFKTSRWNATNSLYNKDFSQASSFLETLKA